MGKIEPKSTLLSKYLATFENEYLMNVFEEIAKYHETGKLKGKYFRELVNDCTVYLELENHTDNSRLLEREVLYEMARRFYNFYNTPISIDDHAGMFSWLSKIRFG